MFYSEKIEKIQPIILFLFFLLAISSILPLAYLAPLDSADTNISSKNIDAHISFKLDGTNIRFVLTINSLQSLNFNSSTRALAVNTRVNDILSHTSSFDLLKNNSIQFPIVFSSYFTLDENVIYSLDYKLDTLLYLVYLHNNSNQYTSEAITFGSITHIGRYDQSLYQNWFLITIISTSALWIYAILAIKKKTGYLIKTIIHNFFEKSYDLYEKVFSVLDENINSIFLVAPLIITFSLLLQIYNHFAQIESVTFAIFQLKFNVLIFLMLYTFLTIFSPAAICLSLDKYKKYRQIKKTRINNNIIFSPFFVLFYILFFILVLIIRQSWIFYLGFILSVIFQIFIFYNSIHFHIHKYNYNMSKKEIIIFSIAFKVIYLGLMIFLLQSFVSSNFATDTNVPYYLLLL